MLRSMESLIENLRQPNISCLSTHQREREKYIWREISNGYSHEWKPVSKIPGMVLRALRLGGASMWDDNLYLYLYIWLVNCLSDHSGSEAVDGCMITSFRGRKSERLLLDEWYMS